MGGPPGIPASPLTPLKTMDFLSHPAFWIVVAAASELIALSPLKGNSIVQLVFQVLSLLKAKKG